MKTSTKILQIAFMLAITSCGGRKQEPVQVEADSVKTVILPKYTHPDSGDPTLQAVSRFITDSLSEDYEPADICIPVIQVVGKKVMADGSIDVYGCFYVWNYKLEADTLFTKSGGSYPGKMTVMDSQVVRFDCVEDGSRFQSSARRIFGSFYKAFQKVNADDKTCKQVRLATVKEYVSRHRLDITHIRDFGWPAVALPEITSETVSEAKTLVPSGKSIPPHSSSRHKVLKTDRSSSARSNPKGLDNMRGFDPASEAT